MLRALFAVLVLAVAVGVSVVSARPPAPASSRAPAAGFSAERALEHLRVIAARPHRTGSPADDDVRAYLVRQLRSCGFSVDVQDAISVETRYVARGWPVVAAHVRNVVARRRGTAPGPALVLMAHYDSRELAPGASDDGYGTAALLETARALFALPSPPLVHDVVVLLTEGEEQGLLGAKAFVEQRPEARDAGLVLNFDARGDAGPSTMFQTSAHAADLVDVLARAVPRVQATSLSQEVYRRMPNDTDLSVWLRAGVPGMSFANVGGFARYHAPTDTVANADVGTLQQDGSYALALARAFGNRAEMAPPTTRDEVYFDVGPRFVHYDARLALPLAASALLLLVAVVVVGARSKAFRAGGVALGLAGGLVLPVVAGIAAKGAAWLALRVSAGALASQWAREDLTQACTIGLLLLGAAVAWAGFTTLARGWRPDVAIGAMLPWGALAVAAALRVPGGSYLLAWPLVFASMAWALKGRLGLLAHFVAAALAVMLLLPVARQLGAAFGLVAAPAIGATAALGVCATLPLVGLIEDARPHLAPALLAAAGAAVLASAALAPCFDARYPRPDTLVYAVDADRGAAWWLSTDDAPDRWTSHVLAKAEHATVPEVWPGPSPANVLRATAPLAPLFRPRVKVLSDHVEHGSRFLDLQIQTAPGTELVSLYAAPEAHVTGGSLGGESYGPLPDGSVQIRFTGPPPGGVRLVVATAGGELPLRVAAQSRGFPAVVEAALPPRPHDLAPRGNGDPLRASDMTLVAASFHL